jgi:hypothetical protein
MKSAVIALLRQLANLHSAAHSSPKVSLTPSTLTEIIGSVLTLLSVGWMALDKSKGEPNK